MSARILVVEDDRGIRVMLERGLGLAGHQVLMAESLATGRAMWSSADRFDIVLLDVMLPDGDGMDLLTERRGVGDRTPTVLLTAREEADLRERAVAAGAEAYLPKPFALADLLACVARFAPQRLRE